MYLDHVPIGELKRIKEKYGIQVSDNSFQEWTGWWEDWFKAFEDRTWKHNYPFGSAVSLYLDICMAADQMEIFHRIMDQHEVPPGTPKERIAMLSLLRQTTDREG